MEEGVLGLTIVGADGIGATCGLVWYRYTDDTVFWSVPHILAALYAERSAHKTLKHLWNEVSYQSLQQLEREGHVSATLQEPSKRMLGFNAESYTHRTRNDHTCSTRLLLHICLVNMRARARKTQHRYRSFCTAFLRALAAEAWLQEDRTAILVVVS
eukprot:2202446-Amphidinium_carterae.3